MYSFTPLISKWGAVYCTVRGRGFFERWRAHTCAHDRARAHKRTQPRAPARLPPRDNFADGHHVYAIQPMACVQHMIQPMRRCFRHHGGRSHQGRRGVPVEARRRWEALRLDQEQRNAPERLLRCGLVWGLQATARPGGVRREQRGTSALDRRLGCDACARAADHLSACRPSSHEA